MIYRLRYLLFLTLLLTASFAAGQYSIDKVCLGSERYYRVTGEANSTYTWQIKDPAGNLLPQLSNRDTLGVSWNTTTGLFQLSVIQHGENNCDALMELGIVEVFGQPAAFAGNDFTFCSANPVVLSAATAGDYSGLLWTSSGDGTFDNDTLLHATYTPGANDLAAGHFVLTLSASGKGNAGSCQPAVSAVTVRLETLLSSAASTAASCFGVTDGTVSLTATGGTEPYSYSLAGNTNSTGIFTGLAPGTYSYTVSDSMNCGNSGEITVGSTTAMTAQLSMVPADCFGASNGSILITGARGGSGNFSYSMDAVNWQAAASFAGLPAGVYTVYMRDAAATACVVFLGNVQILEPAILFALSGHTNLSLPGANDGSITVFNPSGGSGNYEYSLDGINWQSSAFFGNLPAGTYKIYMRDASATGCSVTIGMETILDGLSVIVTAINVSCNGSADGQAVAVASGGTPPYFYLWNDPLSQTSSTAINLAPGIYTVVVTDSAGNSVSASDTVAQPGIVLPVFALIGPLCHNSSPPALPSVSLNGFSGSWSPAVISTAVTGPATYTFTPDSGQCAGVSTMVVTTSDRIIPVFNTIGPFCQNAVPPVLPDTSVNNIPGTWMPATINTATIGSFIYTFIPDTSQCADTVSLTIVISYQIMPQFAGIGPLCQNSIPPLLPYTSLNGISGNWNPATISTTIPGVTLYTFTPDTGQCSAAVSMAVQVDSLLIPHFAAIGPLCQNSPAPALPDTSLNGIAGTWTPGSIHTAAAGTFTYTFTANAGFCAETASLNIRIIPQILPAFASIGPLCQNIAAPQLPGTSLNGISGSWSPAFINTSDTGTWLFRFTPDTLQCAASASLSVTVKPGITPAFGVIGPFCHHSVPPNLPDTSLNGIHGTWQPPTISTGSVGSLIYSFTPDTGLCAVTMNRTIIITDRIVPQFAAIAPLCRNSAAPELPLVSLEGIQGSWKPAIISTSANGFTTYTFTPDNSECAVQTALVIEIQGPEISSVETITSTNGLANGHAVIHTRGGDSLFMFSLNGIDWQVSPEFTGLVAGSYTAWMKDASGCETFMQFMITNTIIGQVGVLAGDVLSCISVPIQIPVMAYNFTNIAAFTIQLSYDSTLLTYNGLTQISKVLNEGVLSTSLVAPGVVQISFTATDSITLHNDALLFNLNFFGLASGSTDLQWNWLRCVIYSAAGYELPAIYTKGAVEIRPAPQVFTTGGGDYCEGTVLTLKAGSLTSQKLYYTWNSPGGMIHQGDSWELGPVPTSASGVYRLTASDTTACSKTENLLVQVYANPVVHMADYDTLCSEQAIILKPGEGYASYKWQDGSTEPQLEATQEGLYWVIVTDFHGCEGGDSVLMRPCELLLWMPNAFSPNGDGLNDVFGPKYNLDLDFSFHMLIFNKWGEQIFESNSVKKPWDGTFKGKACPPDLYTWTISFHAPNTYHFIQKSPQSGMVMLLK